MGGSASGARRAQNWYTPPLWMFLTPSLNKMEGENEEIPTIEKRQKSSVISYAFQTLVELIIRLIIIHDFEDP